jgi:AcrR family transcriptional regulator
MNGYTKGANTRERIVNAARELFNEYGIGMTLSNLASKMEITLGMLTYHFPTKDSIFLAIAEDYEQKRALQREQDYAGKFSIEVFSRIIGKVMDLQYDYRCAMRYISSISNSQSDLANHTTERYKLNRQLIQRGIQILVSEGELKSTILEEENFKVFLFTFSSLTTSWIINLEIYDYEESYETIKPVYLKGIFSTYIPFVTPLGEESLRKLNVIR